MKLSHTKGNDWLPSIFDEMLGQGFAENRKLQRQSPSVNITESDSKFTLSMAVPGYGMEELEIAIEKDLLTISSNVESTEKEASEQYTRREFTKSSFERSFNLPEVVAQDKVEADYTNGVLTISLPKKDEAKPQPKRMISLKK